MKTRGAILRQSPGTFETAELDLEGPRSGELTVKMAASGLCHSDDHIATGDHRYGTYPLCGGHEGSGVVVEVGVDTPGWAVGDHVVSTFIPACGRCRWCAEGKQNLCDLGATMMFGSRFEDPTSFRMSLDGAPVGQMCGISTFSELTTLSVNSVVKVAKDIPLDTLSLLGCCVGTGWGSAVNAAQVGPRDTVIVMGVGGIGMSAVQGAAHAGARDVIAVDPVPFKREQAMLFGATHVAADMTEATDLARSFTNGQGADAAIVTVGVTTADHVSQAFSAIRKAGVVVVTGAGPAGVSQLPINLAELTNGQKRLVGALYGQSSPFSMIPKLVDLYTAGRLKLDEMVTRTYTLGEVAQGYKDMHAGHNIRGMVVFS
jgi:S-(hydroxymethyl)glutathione dehydrogenase/alcohol dehydrogenase